MNKNDIISNLFTGKNFTECINKMEPDHLREDLRQEVILVICELPEEKIFQLHKDKALEFFTVRVILNLIKSNTSPFHKKYRRCFEAYLEVNDYATDKKNPEVQLALYVSNKANNAVATNKVDLEERKLKEDKEDQAIAEIENLYWYNKGLIELYVEKGNFRAVSKETGIPLVSCHTTIKKSFREIKEKVNKPLFSKEELNFIQNNKAF